MLSISGTILRSTNLRSQQPAGLSALPTQVGHLAGFRVQRHDPVVVEVGDVQLAVRVERQAARRVQLLPVGAVLAGKGDRSVQDVLG